jgi:hypothetical protein
MSLDFGDIEAFAKDLDHQGAKVVLAQRQVVKKGALNVKTRLQAEAQGVAHAPGFPRAITFDVELKGDEITAEIGPEKGGAGSLALLYLGNSKTGPRLPEPMLAADAESEVMADYLGKVAEDIG